jgi:hypothetical protein
LTTAAPEPGGFSVAILLAGQVSSQVPPLDTVTEKLQLAIRLFDSSCPSQLTGVVPSGKVEPDGGSQVIVKVGQPLAVGSV